jgi:GntR family transcriptional regulator/MocR family aminotransferase
MRIPLDRQSLIPLYKQIENYLRDNILSGSLEADTRLPATRAMAKDLGVSRITVQNAYMDLESEGLIYNREGSGAYVMPALSLPKRGVKSETAWPLWQQDLKTDVLSPRFSPQVLNPSHPDLIAFTGVGDPQHFPLRDFYKALQTVIRTEGIDALVYGEFDGGYPPLRETIAHVLASQGIQADPGQVLITSGSQQALSLVCQVLLKPGDAIVVEDPTYNFALELFRSLDFKIVGVPVDKGGMQVELLESLLQQRHPSLIYTIPNFQNPTGACLSGVRRRQLVALADCYDVPILEDDFAGDLRYDGRAQPALKALDTVGNVIYVGTFSKMLMPGLRIGYLVADGPVFDALVDCKRVHDLTTSNLLQRTLNVYVSVGRYQSHLRRSSRIYRQRRDAMLDAIREHLPEDVLVYPPDGGLFIWMRLPGGLSATDLLSLALQKGVSYAPGAWFTLDPQDGERYLRLNFATQPLERIRKGIRRLGAALRRCMVPQV